MKKLNINQIIKKLGLSFFTLFFVLSITACSNQNANENTVENEKVSEETSDSKEVEESNEESKNDEKKKLYLKLSKILMTVKYLIAVEGLKTRIFLLQLTM